jgi:predicted protein tyrosine phosphatase
MTNDPTEWIDGFIKDGFIGDLATYTGLQVEVMSRSEAEDYIPGENEVCISIKSAAKMAMGSDRQANLHSNFIDIMRLEFDDTGMEMLGIEGAKEFTKNDAKNVWLFVMKHIDKKKLVIHCFAGLSRSRSMAAAIVDSLGLPYKYSINNKSLYTLMKETYQDERKQVE